MVDREWYLRELEGELEVTRWDICLAFLLALIIILAVFGNLAVIASVALCRALRTCTNLIVVSLAVADLLVGCLVMTVALMYELLKYWPLSSSLCHAWISLDVMCCTSSILHICVISLDRYIAIVHPLHHRNTVTMFRLVVMLTLVWIISFLFAFLPIHYGWNKNSVRTGPDMIHPQCFFINSKTYALVTSLLTFYVPLFIIIITYANIFGVARRQARKIAADMAVLYHARSSSQIQKQESSHSQHDSNEINVNYSISMHSLESSGDVCISSVKTSPAHIFKTSTTGSSHINADVTVVREHQQLQMPIEQKDSKSGKRKLESTAFTNKAMTPIKAESTDHEAEVFVIPTASTSTGRRARQVSPMPQTRRGAIAEKKYSNVPVRTIEPLRKEYKAAKTLGLIIICFCLCWLPFFVIYTVHPYNPSFVTSVSASKVTVWLGYFNSCVNPFLYTYTKDFRRVFKLLLRCNFSKINYEAQ